MKSKLRSLITVTVVVIGLIGALSCSAFAAESPKLCASYNINGTVTVNYTKDSTDDVFAAFYDSNGHQLRCVTAEDGVPITPPQDAAHFKAFLLNQDSVPQHPAAELSLPASCCTVYTAEELQTVMDSESFRGAILGNDLALDEATIPAGKTLTVPKGTTLTVSGTLNVYGALINNGVISNFGFIDVLGGALINGGTIQGNWDEAGQCYNSTLGIEGGATVENSSTINDGVSVADYYWENDEAICQISGELEITDGYIAVAFGAEQIQSCLNSDKRYDIVMPCGDDPENVNIIELGNITVPEEKTLLLKGSIFDGEHSYENTYQISEGTTLTLEADSALLCMEDTALQNYGTLNVYGSLINNGVISNFGFIDVLGGALFNGGTIQGNRNEAGEYYNSTLGIEGGASVENNGTINDGVSVADYYRAGGNAICQISGKLEITDGYIAVAFGAEQIQSCLDSDKDYDIVMPCGDDPENVNTIELGDITVPEGKTLLLKGSIFDGEHSYTNTYQISEDTTLTLEADSALLCMEDTALQNHGTLHVYGSLINNGVIGNFGFIDVLGGVLFNGGTIQGNWDEAGEYYNSTLGIEGGASVENNGTINDGVSVADYYWENDEAICQISGELEITDGYIAVAFGAEQIQSCLNSDKRYDIVMPCGTDPNASNTIKLDNITVPEGKVLLLKDSIFDGEYNYANTYQISEGTTLTLNENAALFCVGTSGIVINGSIDNQGGSVAFGEFEVTGTGYPGNG